MRPSRGWYWLLGFWLVIVSLSGLCAGILQVLGPPNPAENSVQRNNPAPAQMATLVPDPPVANAPPPAVAAPEAPTAAPASPALLQPPAPAVAAPEEPTVAPASAALLQPPAPPVAVPDQPKEASAPPQPPVPAVMAAREPAAASETDQSVRREPPPPADPIVHLRLSRDEKVCAKTACLRWHVTQPHPKLPQAAALDFARLRLAPGVRQAAETGAVDLIVDAVEHHRTVNGRDSVVLVLTYLAAVIPREKSP